MGKVFFYLLGSTIALIIFLVSCKKELSCEGCRGNNQPPVANAGADETIILPKDSIHLDGTASTDPDGTITSYKWIKISGPGSSNIIKADSPKTAIISLVMGVYKFELTVTDNMGLSAKDTVQIMVDNPAVNQPPVACAGEDQTIPSEMNTISLDGRCSIDPDNNIIGYTWSKISGPDGTIATSNAPQTVVTGLVQGVYLFQLKVTDAGGLSATDTVMVTVIAEVTTPACEPGTRPQINARLTPFGTLSQPSSGILVATAGNKIVFAGPARVDLYDISTQSWSTAEVRYGSATAVLDDKIYIAAGNYNGNSSSRIEVYDALTNRWSSLNMPALTGRGAVDAAAAAGNKVLFVSGTQSAGPPPSVSYTLVDIYDVVKRTWRIDTLHNRTQKAPQVSTSDAGIAATVIGSKIYLAGNASDWIGFGSGSVSSTINIYDVVTERWTASQLAMKRGFMAAIAVGNKNYWAGGVNGLGGSWTNSVEIRDMSSGATAFGCLSQVNAQFSAVQKNNNIVFFTSFYASGSAVPSYPRNTFDIYNPVTNTWSIGVLPFAVHAASVISVKNTVYVAGGFVNGVLSNQVWKLEF